MDSQHNKNDRPSDPSGKWDRREKSWRCVLVFFRLVNAQSLCVCLCVCVHTDSADERCFRFSDCVSCTANTHGCQWCEDKKCISASSNCTVVRRSVGGAGEAGQRRTLQPQLNPLTQGSPTLFLERNLPVCFCSDITSTLYSNNELVDQVTGVESGNL